MTKRALYKPRGAVQPRPELTKAATLLLRTLCVGAEVFEFGSGGSTLWLAGFARRLVSIEDDVDWYKVVKEGLLKQGTIIDVRLVSTAKLPDAIDGSGEWDVVFVDCLTQLERRRSVTKGAEHVRPGGWLVADDYNFPMVAKTVDELKRSGWDVALVSGVKVHPVRNVPVAAVTAFCQKPEGMSG